MRALTFVTGKGGVGKTRIANLLQTSHPKASLAETSEALQKERSRLNLAPAPIIRFDRQGLLKDLLIRTLKIESLSDFLSRQKIFQTLLQISPNLHEMLLMHQWTQHSQLEPLIVDAPSTGHFIHLFKAMTAAQKLFDGGSLRKLADQVLTTLHEPKRVTVWIVALAEHSALAEALEIESFLKQNFSAIEVKMVINRMHIAPEGFEIADPHLRALAFERPLREAERLKTFKPDHRLLEGASAW